MQCVIDASVVIKWFIPEPHKEQADKVLTGLTNESLDLIAPDILVAEVGNALWKRSALPHQLSSIEAADSFEDFLGLDIRLHSSTALARHAYALAVSEKRAIYDMIYVTLAKERSCPLITADEKLFRALGKTLAA
jgi:predicted nucleic acid-binding protein